MKNILRILMHEKTITHFFLLEICFFILLPLSWFSLNSPYLPIFLIVLFTLGVSSFYLLYKASRSLSNKARENAEKEILLRQKEIQNEHILSSMQATKDFIKIRDRLVEIIQKQNIPENVDYRAYTNQMIDQYANDLFINYCPNKVIDAILYNKILIMKKLHISHSIQAIIPEELNIDYFAIMSVLNNMLDNAIEACQALSFLRRKIHINLYVKSNYLIFHIENTIDPNKKIKLTPGFSTKEDASLHGLGLQIIHQVCNEHQGKFTYQIAEDQKTITCIATLQLKEEA